MADDTGTHTHHVHGMCPSGRMSFFDVFVELTNPGSIDSFFDVFVDFSMDGSHGAQPDLRTMATGDFEAYPTPVEATTWTGIKNLLR